MAYKEIARQSLKSSHGWHFHMHQLLGPVQSKNDEHKVFPFPFFALCFSFFNRHTIYLFLSHFEHLCFIFSFAIFSLCIFLKSLAGWLLPTAGVKDALKGAHGRAWSDHCGCWGDCAAALLSSFCVALELIVPQSPLLLILDSPEATSIELRLLFVAGVHDRRFMVDAGREHLRSKEICFCELCGLSLVGRCTTDEQCLSHRV